MPFVMPLVIEGGHSLSSARHQATLVSRSTRASDRKFFFYWSSSCGYDFKYLKNFQEGISGSEKGRNLGMEHSFF